METAPTALKSLTMRHLQRYSVRKYTLRNRRQFILQEHSQHVKWTCESAKYVGNNFALACFLHQGL